MFRAALHGLIGCALLAFGANGYTILANVSTLTCTRSTGLCVVERQKAFSKSTVEFPLGELTGAELQDYRGSPPSSSGESNAARLVFLTKGKPVPLMLYDTGVGLDEMTRQAAAVNAFLERLDQPSLQVRRDDRRIGLYVAVVPVLLGLILLVGALRTAFRQS